MGHDAHPDNAPLASTSNPTLSELVSRAGATAPQCGQVRLICIDGPAGSGKSTLAQSLSEALDGCPVVHMDDLYDGWHQQLGDDLAARVEAWLLLAWQVGLPGHHLRADWERERFSGWAIVEPAPCIVLEGCGSTAARIRPYASLTIWIQAPREVRLVRGVARDGSHMLADWRKWQAMEADHFLADGTARAADVIIDGTAPIPG